MRKKMFSSWEDQDDEYRRNQSGFYDYEPSIQCEGCSLIIFENDDPVEPEAKYCEPCNERTYTERKKDGDVDFCVSCCETHKVESK